MLSKEMQLKHSCKKGEIQVEHINAVMYSPDSPSLGSLDRAHSDEILNSGYVMKPVPVIIKFYVKKGEP